MLIALSVMVRCSLKAIKSCNSNDSMIALSSSTSF